MKSLNPEVDQLKSILHVSPNYGFRFLNMLKKDEFQKNGTHTITGREVETVSDVVRSSISSYHVRTCEHTQQKKLKS